MVDKVVLTPRFKSGVKKLYKDHKIDDLKKLKSIIKKLEEQKLPAGSGKHRLQGRTVSDVHISGDTILLYRYDGDILYVELQLIDITSHVRMEKKSTNAKLTNADKLNPPLDITSIYEK